MKKQLLLLLLCCSALLQTHAQTELLTIAENKLNGPVKSAVTKAHWMKEMFGELEPSSFYFSESLSFNKDGLTTLSTREENNGYKIEYNFKYDRDNRLIQKNQEYGKEKEKKKYTWKFVYDAQGRQTETNTYGDKNELASKQKMKFRDDGKLREAVNYNSDGDVNVRIEYIYNDKNLLTAVTTYNREEKVIKKAESAYDSDGNKTNEEIKEFVGKYGTDIWYAWRYIGGKKIVEVKMTLNDNKKRQYSKTFDEWGNVIKEVEASGTIITTVYTFDSNNNWITATSSWKGIDGPVNYRKVREIKYY
jgi:hypothetical protein